jgi:hypothetical protein
MGRPYLDNWFHQTLTSYVYSLVDFAHATDAISSFQHALIPNTLEADLLRKPEIFLSSPLISQIREFANLNGDCVHDHKLGLLLLSSAT